MIPFTELVKGAELSVLENVTGKQVPQGTPLTLGVGEMVTVTQALGDTVTLDIGSRLVRIETLDLVKLGVQAPENLVSDLSASLESQVWEVLRQSYDPEIPVNIVDLGLIYDIRISTLIDGRTHIRIDMTLTAPWSRVRTRVRHGTCYGTRYQGEDRSIERGGSGGHTDGL